MSKFLEIYTPNWPLIVKMGNIVNISEAIKDILPLIDELSETMNYIIQKEKEYPESPIQLSLLLREKREHYKAKK